MTLCAAQAQVKRYTNSKTYSPVYSVDCTMIQAVELYSKYIVIIRTKVDRADMLAASAACSPPSCCASSAACSLRR